MGLTVPCPDTLLALVGSSWPEWPLKLEGSGQQDESMGTGHPSAQDSYQARTPFLTSSLTSCSLFLPTFCLNSSFVIPPTFSHLHLSIPVLLISAFTTVLPVLEEAGKAGRGSGQCFSGWQSWHINGSRNQFGGSWNQFKGSWPEFCFKWNQIKSNQMVSTKHSEDKYRFLYCIGTWGYVPNYNVKHVSSMRHCQHERGGLERMPHLC